ncbi:MAG: 2-hydroxyacyl-CoA dehydratase family protein [Clostridia bacterium]|nr:2-hydroxyacyl-CoA dehydratase family protein [Clostridia bacterium]
METKLTSKQMLGQLLKKHYRTAVEAKKNGKIVAWATSICPQELLETMNIDAVYPENHAAAIGARKEALRYIQQSEGKGYSADICSYARVNMGYVDIKHSDAENIPMPDLIFCCSNICNTVIKWYENLAKTLNVPLIMFDMPFNHTFDVPEHSIKYMTGQIEHAIVQLEEITGRRFDHDRFKEVMEISADTARWWRKAADLNINHPSPLNGFDMFNYMAVIVCMRGTKEGRDLFKLWYEELKGKVENGKGPWRDQEEKYRVMWDGIACWPHLSDTYKVLKKHGVNMVTSTYPESWTIVYEKGDIDGMARAYASNYANRNLEYGTNNVAKLVRDFDLDGIIYHSNRSCKLMDFRQYEVQRRIEAMTGVPSVIFDGDQTDPRIFSLSQYETRVQALIEMMEKNKEAGRIG